VQGVLEGEQIAAWGPRRRYARGTEVRLTPGSSCLDEGQNVGEPYEKPWNTEGKIP